MHIRERMYIGIDTLMRNKASENKTEIERLNEWNK